MSDDIEIISRSNNFNDDPVIEISIDGDRLERDAKKVDKIVSDVFSSYRKRNNILNLKIWVGSVVFVSLLWFLGWIK